jgi:hypothetical protein
VKVDFVQVPEDFRQAKCALFAAKLSELSGRRVTRGEALAIVVDLWAWHLQQVDERAPVLSEAFRAAALIPSKEAALRMHVATGWQKSKAGVLLEALSHPMVRVLVPCLEGWEVADLQHRYLVMATRQQESRSRARLNALAHDSGWEPVQDKNKPKGLWRHASGEELHWKDLLVRLEVGDAPHPPTPEKLRALGS